jgi:hypothetical protein
MRGPQPWQTNRANKIGEARPNKWLPLTPTLSPQKSGERER